MTYHTRFGTRPIALALSASSGRRLRRSLGTALALALMAGLGLTADGRAQLDQVPVRPLQVEPEQGIVGTPITVTGQGLPPGRAVQLMWATVNGGWDMNANVETIEFYDRTFTPTRLPLGGATTDAAGNLSATFPVPEDYGEVHDIYAVVDGQDVGRGGFAVVRNVTISASEGPIGTPITIEVKGLGWTPFANTMGVLYDNTYTGFISAVTTRGTGRGQIRAVGPVGDHTIRVTDASAAMPYLNTEQSPRKLPQFQFGFRVTEDAGPPVATLDWPDGGRVGTADGRVRTTAGSSPAAPGFSARFTPAAGPILSPTTLQAAGLAPGSEVDLRWVSVRGNRVSPSGWNLTESSLGKASAGSDGRLEAALEIPDDLGGWHMVKVVQGERVLGEAPYFVERSLATVSPAQVRAGETFQVQVKGIGWTELDNGFAVVYDNSYMGYACGFNSQGDVTLNLVANGGPGTHLIDLYPMIFLGHGKGPWNYDIPQLSFAEDHPSLEMGYRLPAFRLAIEVVE